MKKHDDNTFGRAGRPDSARHAKRVADKSRDKRDGKFTPRREREFR